MTTTSERPASVPEQPATPPPRTRRALLTAGLGGMLGAVAATVGRPFRAAAAAGSNLIIGSSTNNAGTSNTLLTTSSSVVAFELIQNGPGTALMGYVTPGSGATRGVYGRTDSPSGFGVQARNAGSAGSGAAVQAIGVNNTAVDASTATTAAYAVHGVGGNTGVHGETTRDNGNGVVGICDVGAVAYGVYGQSNTGFGVYSQGDCRVNGDFTASGSKAGYVVDVAINGSRTTLKQGDPVTLLGVRDPVLGAIPLLVVAPAKQGDPVIGVVDRQVVVTPNTKALGDGNHVKGKGTVVAPEEHLYVVTLGAFAVASADASEGAIAPGTRLAAGRDGKLVKAQPVDVNGRKLYPAGENAGYALGALPSGSGQLAIFVNPH